MMRFAGGLRRKNDQVVMRIQFDGVLSADWLDHAIRHLFKRDSRVVQVLHKTPAGDRQGFDVVVERNAVPLAMQSGILDRRMQVVRGIPVDIAMSNIAQMKAIWRGAFLAHGIISEPGTRGYLEVICPSQEAAEDLQQASLRLGIRVFYRQVNTSHRITLTDTDAIERLLVLIGAPMAAREWTGKRNDTSESRPKGTRLANFDDANMRRSVKAASEACDRVRHAFEVLGDDVPENLKAAGQLRLEHDHASLAQLGCLAKPPITKDAVAGRIRRLLQLAEKVEAEKAAASQD